MKMIWQVSPWNLSFHSFNRFLKKDGSLKLWLNAQLFCWSGLPEWENASAILAATQRAEGFHIRLISPGKQLHVTFSHFCKLQWIADLMKHLFFFFFKKSAKNIQDPSRCHTFPKHFHARWWSKYPQQKLFI